MQSFFLLSLLFLANNVIGAPLNATNLPICFVGSIPCGRSCCPTTLVLGAPHFCADPIISLCCVVGTHNSNGICCPVGQFNSDGGLCCPMGTTNNGGICCLGGSHTSNGKCCPIGTANSNG